MKKRLTGWIIIRYDSNLNGYSLIPSWWRDRPYETQQPDDENDFIRNIFVAKVLNLMQG
jgi:hypothetical protein